jgi:hypothetical protein
VRELVFAAKQYSATNSEGTPDYDSLYNHALVLTELASKIQAGSQEQLAFLQQVTGRSSSLLSGGTAVHLSSSPCAACAFSCQASMRQRRS